MAKSARASSRKASRTKLRARVFGPAEKARAERLHAKLLETVEQPKPEKMEMDTAEDAPAEETKEDGFPKDMELDNGSATATKKQSTKEKAQSRKQLRRKPQNKISFPTSRGKGALKPFARSRVSKRRS